VSRKNVGLSFAHASESRQICPAPKLSPRLADVRSSRPPPPRRSALRRLLFPPRGWAVRGVRATRYSVGKQR
jgi:hypothetical protein